MDYELAHSDLAKPKIIVPASQVDTNSTSLSLIGFGTANFGEKEQTNFLHLLENFASHIAPANPIIGQIWYDTSINELKSFDGLTWSVVNQAVEIAGAAPANALEGSLWYNIINTTLNLYTNGSWSVISQDFANLSIDCGEY